MSNLTVTGPRTLILFEEYRPAWEIGGTGEPVHGHVSQIEHGWEIRTDNGDWVGIEGNLSYTSSDPAKAPVTVLLLKDGSKCEVWTDDVVMSRRWQRGAE